MVDGMIKRRRWWWWWKEVLCTNSRGEDWTADRPRLSPPTEHLQGNAVPFSVHVCNMVCVSSSGKEEFKANDCCEVGWGRSSFSFLPLLTCIRGRGGGVYECGYLHFAPITWIQHTHIHPHTRIHPHNIDYHSQSLLEYKDCSPNKRLTHRS